MNGRILWVFWGIVAVRVLLCPHAQTVWPIYSAAAQRAWAGQPLYELIPGYDLYRYPPPMADMFAPLAWLPLGIAGVVWRALGLAGLLLALRAFQTVRGGLPTSPWLGLLLIPLILPSLNNGQINLHLVALMLGGTVACVMQRWNIAAGCWAVASVAKVYPLFLFLGFVAMYPRQLAGRFLLLLTALLALPLLWHTPQYVIEQYAGWWAVVSGDVRQWADWTYAPRDARQLWRAWIGPIDLTTYRLLQVILAVGLTWATRHNLWQAFHFGMIALVVFGPASESSTYILLGPTVVWAMLRGVQGAVHSYALLLIAAVAAWLPGGWRLQAAGLQPLAGLLLMFALIRHFRRTSLLGNVRT